MALVPLEIPAGAYRNGTEYQAKGRWRDVSLVRWREGAMLPVGGLRRAWSKPSGGSTTRTDYVRSGLGWVDNSSNQWAIYGNYSTVKVIDDSGGATDITPVGLSTLGNEEDDRGVWQFAAFGEIPLACFKFDGKIWEWDLNTANNLTQVTNSPTSCRGVFVTAERFVVALGAGGDPRKIQWSDREDRTTWTAAATNQAGDFNLDSEGEIMFAAQLRGEWIVVTTADVWRARYVGYPDVYAFDRVGVCGCAGPLCGVSSGEFVIWPGIDGFYVYEAGSVSPLPCDIGDYLFSGPDRDFYVGDTWKTTGWHNKTNSEAWWLYASALGDIDSYVSYDYQEGLWSYGEWSGTAVISQAAIGADGLLTPLGFFNESELVTNGGFDTDSDWTKGSNWQISGGVASQTSPTSSSITQDISGLRLDVPYEVRLEIASSTTGNLQVVLGGSSSTASGDGTHNIVLTPQTVGPSELNIGAANGFDGTVDNVSLSLAPYAQVDYYDSSAHLSDPYAKTGPFELGNGNRRVHVTKLYPDEQDGGELKFTFGHREYPTATETTESAVTAANPTDLRFSGRQFTMRVEAATENTDWRSGVHRLEIEQGGER